MADKEQGISSMPPTTTKRANPIKTVPVGAPRPLPKKPSRRGKQCSVSGAQQRGYYCSCMREAQKDGMNSVGRYSLGTHGQGRSRVQHLTPVRATFSSGGGGKVGVTKRHL